MTADSPLFSGTILGLRAWTVRIGLPSSTTRLEALVTEADWEPGGAWTRARCGVPEHLHDGPAPQPGCSCGLYAWHPRPGPARRLFTDNVASVEDDHAMAPVDFSVFGVVEAAGVIEVHQTGFRAERARPVAFVAGADWGEGLRAGLGELAGIYGVEVISARDWRDVVAACEELGGVLSEARVDELLE
nr:hypothetical protein [Chloroflexota bacterium]